MFAQRVGPEKLLIYVLQQWADAEFPVPRGDVAAGMDTLWRMLARALCGPDQRRRSAFEQELIQHYGAGRGGDPPIHALEQRLQELTEAGIGGLFLVVAIRRALDSFIGMHFPAASQGWISIADMWLPLHLQFAEPEDRLLDSHAVLDPRRKPIDGQDIS